MSWWAGNETAMRHYHNYQKHLDEHGIELHLMVNAPDENAMRKKLGVRGALCSKNLFCDEEIFKLSHTDKVYDAIYIAQLQDFKRHALASDINKLVILSYGGDLASFCPEVSHAAQNKQFLPQGHVARAIQRSVCGLCLSEIEGQMNAAVEYLLCGIPVVTTPSRGGRDLFFDSRNSLTVPATARHVASATEHWKATPTNPLEIRVNVLQALNHWRSVLCDYATELINRYGGTVVDTTTLQSRLFASSAISNQRKIEHQSVRDARLMAPFAIEDQSLRVKLKPDLAIGEKKKGGVIICNTKGNTLQLDAISTRILETCNQSISIDEILSRFRITYPDAPESMEQDILDTLKTLFTVHFIDVQI